MPCANLCSYKFSVRAWCAFSDCSMKTSTSRWRWGAKDGIYALFCMGLSLFQLQTRRFRHSRRIRLILSCTQTSGRTKEHPRLHQRWTAGMFSFSRSGSLLMGLLTWPKAGCGSQIKRLLAIYRQRRRQMKKAKAFEEDEEGEEGMERRSL
ncbi:hypothetical protein BT69DRAFT_16760 [Atractiella rhizophila]|nr:hypothetical protein BT69DRAFT_16760 [Atractiella rhizophila]